VNATLLVHLLGVLALLGPGSGARAHESPEANAVEIIQSPASAPQPARQDVVVFKYTQPPRTPTDTNYTKRLVGLSGETIVINRGVLSKPTDPVIERIIVEGGKVEIEGERIKIEGGRVEIIRNRRP
jgi:hypothetical protein